MFFSLPQILIGQLLGCRRLNKMVQWLPIVLDVPPNVRICLVFFKLNCLVMTERTRSESPGTRPTVRPSYLGSSPATNVRLVRLATIAHQAENSRCDLDAIQKMFEKCNGVLCFGHEVCIFLQSILISWSLASE